MIYFLKAHDRIKIGHTSDPTNRIMQIQTDCPYKTEILLIIDGTYDEEQGLHKRFQELRKTGEWFDYKDPLKAYIEENKNKDRTYEFGLGCLPDFKKTEQLRRLRKRHNLTAKDLSERVHTSQQAVSRIENAEIKGRVTMKTMQILGRAMGYNFEYRFVPDLSQYTSSDIDSKELREHMLISDILINIDCRSNDVLPASYDATKSSKELWRKFLTDFACCKQKNMPEIAVG